MRYKKGIDRRQTVMFPPTVEDYVSEDNLVRFIDEFVNSINLEDLGFRYARTKSTGRPPYDPGDMMKLYTYGYLNRIRSSRVLEAEAKKNFELIWLLRNLSPDYKTIADFRKDNRNALKQVFKEFNNICKDLGLYGKELIGIDGSKFKACNSRNKNFSKKKLEKSLKKMEDKIEAYLSLLDENDEEEKDLASLSKEELQEKIRMMKERKGQYEDMLRGLKERNENQVSLTDADSRLMKTKQGTDVCYNVQISVDDKCKLIVDYEVTNCESDYNQLSEMAIRAKEFLEVETIKAVADKGYSDGIEIKKCLDNGIIPYVPEQDRKVFTKNGLPERDFYRDRFRYDKEKDVYVCPGGRELPYMGNHEDKGKVNRVYRCDDCINCCHKSKCTDSAKGRYIYRWEHEEIMEENRERARLNTDLIDRRKEIVEHLFGTIKRGFNQGYMLTRGLPKVNGEMGLSSLAYNIRRVVNVVGVPKLIEAVRKRYQRLTQIAPECIDFLIVSISCLKNWIFYYRSPAESIF